MRPPIQFYRPEVESLGLQLAEARRAVEVSKAEVGRQNAEVERLAAETRALLAQAEQVRAQARRQASRDYATAARILLEPPAEGDRCEAARQAFAAELKKERGL